jgi:hypothetical protein
MRRAASAAVAESVAARMSSITCAGSGNSRLLRRSCRLHGRMKTSIGIGLKRSVEWSARLEMCQWIRETLDKESIWDEARSTSLSKW